MKVEIYSIPNCPACKKALALATNHQSVYDTTYNIMGKDFDASTFIASEKFKTESDSVYSLQVKKIL